MTDDIDTEEMRLCPVKTETALAKIMTDPVKSSAASLSVYNGGNYMALANELRRLVDDQSAEKKFIRESLLGQTIILQEIMRRMMIEAKDGGYAAPAKLVVAIKAQQQALRTMKVLAKLPDDQEAD